MLPPTESPAIAIRSGSSAVGGALADDPPGDCVALLDRDRVARLGRAVVLHEHDRRAGAAGQLAHEPVVRAGVAEHPAAAVHVQDHRQRAPAPAGRTMRTWTSPTSAGTVIQRSSIGQLVDRRRLDVVEHLARLVGGQLVQERRRGGRLDERLGRGLEHDRGMRGRYGHGTVLSGWWSRSQHATAVGRAAGAPTWLFAHSSA